MPFSLGLEVKKMKSGPSRHPPGPQSQGYLPFSGRQALKGIDKIFIWSGNSDLLLALVKSVEDRSQCGSRHQTAMVRVLILVEDSPVYYSSFLPLIYKEIVKQTQAVLEVGLNEEHRLLTMRARPKILLAENYEEAMELYQKFRPYLFGIISDARIPRKESWKMMPALFSFTNEREIPDLPLLMMSSDPPTGKRPIKFLPFFWTRILRICCRSYTIFS